MPGSTQAAILHEAIAKGAPIGFLVRPSNPNARDDTRDLVAATEALGHKLIVAEVNAANGSTDWSFESIAWIYGHDAGRIDALHE